MSDPRDYNEGGALTPDKLPGPLRFRLERDFARGGFNVYLLCYEWPVNGKSRRWLLSNVTLTQVPDGGWLPYEPSLYLDGSGLGAHIAPGAQDLMDELWRLGVRPSDQPKGDNTHDLRVHLQDLREIITRVLPSALRGTEP